MSPTSPTSVESTSALNLPSSVDADAADDPVTDASRDASVDKRTASWTFKVPLPWPRKNIKHLTIDAETIGHEEDIEYWLDKIPNKIDRATGKTLRRCAEQILKEDKGLSREPVLKKVNLLQDYTSVEFRTMPFKDMVAIKKEKRVQISKTVKEAREALIKRIEVDMTKDYGEVEAHEFGQGKREKQTGSTTRNRHSRTGPGPISPGVEQPDALALSRSTGSRPTASKDNPYASFLTTEHSEYDANQLPASMRRSLLAHNQVQEDLRQVLRRRVDESITAESIARDYWNEQLPIADYVIAAVIPGGDPTKPYQRSLSERELRMVWAHAFLRRCEQENW